MIYSINKKGELKDIDDSEDLQSKLKHVRMVEKIGQHGFHYDVKELFEPIYNSIKDVSEDVTRTMMESTKENNKALTTLNSKLLEIMNDRGMKRPIFCHLSIITNPESTSHFKLVKGSNSNRVNDLLIHNIIPVTLYDTLLIFRDTNKQFELQGDILKMIT